MNPERARRRRGFVWLFALCALAALGYFGTAAARSVALALGLAVTFIAYEIRAMRTARARVLDLLSEGIEYTSAALRDSGIGRRVYVVLEELQNEGLVTVARTLPNGPPERGYLRRNVYTLAATADLLNLVFTVRRAL